jgi:hypothetical protein
MSSLVDGFSKHLLEQELQIFGRKKIELRQMQILQSSKHSFSEYDFGSSHQAGK